MSAFMPHELFNRLSEKPERPTPSFKISFSEFVSPIEIIHAIRSLGKERRSEWQSGTDV